MSTTAIQKIAQQTPENDLLPVLKASVYPGANDDSINLVLSYCRAAGLDPLQKPVHIVPMWDRNSGQMRDVIMPGIGLYRTQAARSGEYVGVTEPDFGPDVTEKIGNVEITYPAWCRITVKRCMKDGTIAEFSAREFWKENYAVKGGKEKSIAPNAMWSRRPYGQIAKCAEAQALRKAFPEFGAQPTAEEMEGKTIDMGYAVVDVEYVTDEQALELNRLLNESGSDRVAFLTHFGAESIELFPAGELQKATALINQKIAIKNKKQAEAMKAEDAESDNP